MLSLLQYSFVVNAIIGCLLTGIVCGLIGSYVATRRMVFVAGGVAHASLGGVGLCATLGAPPMLGAAIFSLLTALGAHRLAHKAAVRTDSAIAMLWAAGMSIGVVCLFLSPSYLPGLSSYLFGNILYVTQTDLIFMAVIALLNILIFSLRLPQITLLAFDTTFARSALRQANRLELLLLLLTSLSIVACLRTVGIMLVVALMSIPQTTASLFATSFRRLAITSILLSAISCLVGLTLSYLLNVPSGPAIVLVCIVIYALACAIKHLR